LIGVKVHEIPTAAAWAEFVSSYPYRYGDLVYPDWRSASRDHDAVHMTLQAVAATQGVFFEVQGETLAPTYWDVESTLWLRWCFSKPELIRVR
jgi:hypothetical protein